MGTVTVFLSTPSVRRATITLSEFFAKAEDFYPRPPRGGRHAGAAVPFEVEEISIHALREEGDTSSPRSAPALTSFLSTPSARRATDSREILLIVSSISIHALREEGDQGGGFDSFVCGISIHALREEGDTPSRSRPLPTSHFYPRPPRGGRPGNDGPVQRYLQISIHALREEGDMAVRVLPQPISNFYPRPPRGGRPR